MNSPDGLNNTLLFQDFIHGKAPILGTRGRTHI